MAAGLTSDMLVADMESCSEGQMDLPYVFKWTEKIHQEQRQQLGTGNRDGEEEA